jgi:diguanylate cyclase (GGDEF)-like protein
MNEAVEHLAALTGFRDREVLDVNLVGALRDLLQPLRVAIYHCVGDGGRQHWLTRAQLAAGQAVATADPLWADPATLPPLPAHPLRLACLEQQRELMAGGRDGEPALSHFPLATDSEVVGVLEVESRQPLVPEQQRLVRSMLRVFRNFQGLLDYSERDTLTGLLNRKTFDEAFMRHAVAVRPDTDSGGSPTAARRQATDTGAWLAIIDIDHFKRVNDTFGHLIGDEVLLLMARVMRGSFRSSDRLYRFGGEEFAVLMRSAGVDAAAAVFERLRRNVECYAFPRIGYITVSIGFTALSEADTPTSAFERADKAVYFAKAQGRNQVVGHASLVAAGQLADEVRSSDMELF